MSTVVCAGMCQLKHACLGRICHWLQMGGKFCGIVCWFSDPLRRCIFCWADHQVRLMEIDSKLQHMPATTFLRYMSRNLMKFPSIGTGYMDGTHLTQDGKHVLSCHVHLLNWFIMHHQGFVNFFIHVLHKWVNEVPASSYLPVEDYTLGLHNFVLHVLNIARRRITNSHIAFVLRADSWWNVSILWYCLHHYAVMVYIETESEVWDFCNVHVNWRHKSKILQKGRSLPLVTHRMHTLVSIPHHKRCRGCMQTRLDSATVLQNCPALAMVATAAFALPVLSQAWMLTGVPGVGSSGHRKLSTPE